MGRSLFYLTIDIFSKILPFILLPYVTNQLGIKEYGDFALFLALMAMLYIVVGMSTYNTINISFFSKEDWEEITANLFVFWSILTIITSIIFILFFNNKIYLCALFSAYVMWVFQVLIIILQFKEKLFFYSLFQLMRVIIIASAQFFPIYFGFKTSDIIILSYTYAMGIVLFFVLVFLYKNKIIFFVRSLNFSIIRKAHIFSLPLVLNNSSAWIRTSLDRFFLNYYFGAAVVGIYALGFQLGSILGVAGLSLSKAFNFYLLKCVSSDEIDKNEKILKIKRLIFSISFISLIFFMIFVIFIKFFFEFLFSLDFVESIEIAYIVGLAFSFQTIASTLVPLIQFFNKNKYLIYSSLVLTVIGILLLWIFIPIYGTLGASIIFLLSWFFYLIFLMIFVSKTISAWSRQQ